MENYKKTEAGIFIQHEIEYKSSGCCSLHWMPAGILCDDYTVDTGGGILMKNCTNCWYYNDRSLKYERIG